MTQHPDNPAIAIAFSSQDIRLERMLHLGMALVDPDAPPDLFEAFVEDIDGGNPKELGELLPILKKAEYGSDTRNIAHVVITGAHIGFLGQFATPVRNYLSSSSFMAGWGHCYVAWIYADTFEDICRRAQEWAERLREHDRRRATKKAKKVTKGATPKKKPGRSKRASS